LKKQVAEGTYDLEANLGLLRLYNFDPNSTSMTLVSQLLAKALMRLPENDFDLYLHLLPDRYQVLFSTLQCTLDQLTKYLTCIGSHGFQRPQQLSPWLIVQAWLHVR
jgi:hypothetical protein